MIPPVSPMLFGGFARYSRWYLKRHFNGVRLSLTGSAPNVDADRPIIVYLNHAAWWDPLICLHLATTIWPRRKHFAPIDQAALKQYPMLERLGFFGIEKGTRSGSSTFLRVSSAILQRTGTALWITAEGAFTDPRDRSRPVLPGVAHLANRLPEAAVIPLAIEYPFWQERRPEALCGFGSLADSSKHDSIEQALRATQNKLAAEAISQDPAHFETMIRGNTGINVAYDGWRRLRSLLGRRPYAARHGDISA